MTTHYRLPSENTKISQRIASEGGTCTCSDLHVPGAIHGPFSRNLKPRRDVELEKHYAEISQDEEPIITCRMLSPLSYVGGGITVDALGSVRIVGLTVDFDAFTGIAVTEERYVLVIHSTKKLGELTVGSLDLKESVQIDGNGTQILRLSFDQRQSVTEYINLILKSLIYHNTYYDINIRDILEVKLVNFNIDIHVHICRSRRPTIYNQHTNDDITKKVTVITKTFERYECIERLVVSVNRYYPGMTILIADDSEKPQQILGNNVKQFIMPYKEGWFAGRNLVLSQVQTRYFVWVDDDFIFTENTKLENFIQKFEDSRISLDMIGGFFEDVNGTKYILSVFFKTIEINSGDAAGDCMLRNRGFQRNIEEYPECMIVDLVTNFFMAKTQKVRAVGFDPQFERVGHTEHFVDGFGKLRVASCKDVFIIHKSDKNNIKYKKFRRGGESSHISRYYGHEQYVMFKNNLKCFRLG
ncbi:beta-1,4 N-acetylgalactosaminyltransferase 1-like [Glandiceps talaboti]